MKKHELLKFAYDNYPKGTKFISIAHKEDCVSEGTFKFTSEDCDEGINFGITTAVDNIGRYVYRHGKWAEIVKPKIAVKVENEKEFNALMKYYDSLGWKWCNGDKASIPITSCSNPKDYDFKTTIEFKDKFMFNLGCETNQYQIIPFSDFAKDKGIKLPLVKSEDGVWLYEGDDYACIKNLHDKGYKFCFDGKPLEPSHFVITDSSICKAFSTKQSALDWIEAQKPK